MPEKDNRSAPPSATLRQPWSREPCWECGQEMLACRGEPTPTDQPVHCEGCEMMLRGNAALEAMTADRDRLAAEVKRLESRLAAAQRASIVISGSCLECGYEGDLA